MKEIEIKLQIDDPEQVVSLLEKQGHKFSEVIAQDDYIYIPLDQPTVPVPAGVNVLRVREQGDKAFFALKQSDHGNNLSKIEKEFSIVEPEKMREVFELLGYKKATEVHKQRRKCQVSDIEICLDHVEGLGDFMEFERITDEDSSTVQKQLLEFASSLGLDTSRQMHYGYDVLLVQKGNITV